ncbi:MAG: FecR domain-containing protein [Desulfobulbus sp.]|nr:FecR domain-containing protein [Desulfobulbus sp.]
MSPIRLPASLLILPLLLLLLSPALSSPGLAAEDLTLIPLHVKAGTNLIHLARDYCRDRNDWHEIARINQLNEPYLILKDTFLQVPSSLLVLEKLSATVASVHGQVGRVVGKQIVEVHKGERLFPGQTVVTGSNGYTHLILPDHTYTRIEPDSQLTLNYLLRLKDGNVKADFSLSQGRVIHWVRDKLKANETFQTRTPIVLTGIRGTEFRLKTLGDDANNVETLRGRVTVSSSGQSRVIGPGQGIRIEAGNPPQQPQALPEPPHKVPIEPLYRSLPVVIAAPAHAKAKALRLRITSDQLAQATLFDQDAAPGGRFVVSNLPDGAHFASLSAIDKENFESQVVGPLPFNVRTVPPNPVISSPKTGTTLWGKQGTIQWLESEQVAHFELQLAHDPSFSRLIETKEVTEARYTSPELPPGTYYFRVKTVAPDGFNTLYSVPVQWKLAPAPEMKGVEGTANIRPTLQWPVMAEGWTYDLQIASDKNFTNLVVDRQSLPTTAFTLEDRLVAGKYWVRLRGVENGQVASPWTPSQTMTIKPKPPGWEELFFGVVTLGIILL